MPLSVYQCPSASKERTNSYRDGYGRSCYSGKYGSTILPRWIDGHTDAHWAGVVPAAIQGRSDNSRSKSSRPATTQTRHVYGTSTGLFSWNSMARIRDVTDGASNTTIAGERSKISGVGIWAGVVSNRFETDAVTDASHRSPINHSLTGYSSEHNGGVYVVLLDGSVRFVIDSIDSRADGTGVFQRIAGKSDGAATPSDAFTKGPKLF